MSEFWRGETGKSCYVNAVVARALEIELAEMTARAVSLSLHLPPETLVGDVRRWRDEAKAQLAELATARAELAQSEEAHKYACAEKDKHGKYWHDLAQERIVAQRDAESALSLLTAKLAQCEEKLAKQERDILWVETRISCDDSGAEVLRQREQIERLTAAHAKALEDGRRMREALEHYRDTVSAGGSTYARDALAASASATTGNGGEIS